MENLGMSSRNAIFTAFLFIVHVTGITSMADSFAEQAVQSLADVARNMGPFALVIHSTNPEWYSEGIRMFAYSFDRYYWKKTELKWALTKNPTVMTTARAKDAIKAACNKWAARSRFTFKEAASNEIADIHLDFEPSQVFDHRAIHLGDKKKMDGHLGIIRFNDTETWNQTDRGDRTTIQYAALYEMGHILGLRDSNDRNAIMYKGHNPQTRSNEDPQLTRDDIDGIRERYENLVEPESETESDSASSSDDDPRPLPPKVLPPRRRR